MALKPEPLIPSAEVQLDRLNGSRPTVLDRGYVASETCGYLLPFAPSLAGSTLQWVRASSPCEGAETQFVSFSPAAPQRELVGWPPGGLVLGMARDGARTFWISDTTPPKAHGGDLWMPNNADCARQPDPCTPVTSASLAMKAQRRLHD